ncbi:MULTISPECIES: hypothetical protein [Cyanophyceae]|nr:hypothetical protein [Nodosilinea sp. FACHB-141]
MVALKLARSPGTANGIEVLDSVVACFTILTNLLTRSPSPPEPYP